MFGRKRTRIGDSHANPLQNKLISSKSVDCYCFIDNLYLTDSEAFSFKTYVLKLGSYSVLTFFKSQNIFIKYQLQIHDRQKQLGILPEVPKYDIIGSSSSHDSLGPQQAPLIS